MPWAGPGRRSSAVFDWRRDRCGANPGPTSTRPLSGRAAVLLVGACEEAAVASAASRGRPVLRAELWRRFFAGRVPLTRLACATLASQGRRRGTRGQQRCSLFLAGLASGPPPGHPAPAPGPRTPALLWRGASPRRRGMTERRPGPGAGDNARAQREAFTVLTARGRRSMAARCLHLPGGRRRRSLSPRPGRNRAGCVQRVVSATRARVSWAHPRRLTGSDDRASEVVADRPSVCLRPAAQPPREACRKGKRTDARGFGVRSMPKCRPRVTPKQLLESSQRGAGAAEAVWVPS